MKYLISGNIFIDDSLDFNEQSTDAQVFINKHFENRILTEITKGTKDRPLEKLLDFGKEIIFILNLRYRSQTDNSIIFRQVSILKK